MIDEKGNIFDAIDLDEDPDADAVLFGKSRNGVKISGIGHNGEQLSKRAALKYIITDKDNNNFIALALITNNLKNSPWISEEYFESKFPDHFSKGLIYYFMGLAIHDDYKRQGHSLNLIEMIIDDLPHEAIMGFDHSYNINPILHYFTSIVKQAKFIKRKHLDKQSYHIVHRR